MNTERKFEFDIKTFSAENIRIMQEELFKKNSNLLYEFFAREIYKYANSSEQSSITLYSSLHQKEIKFACMMLEQKGFTYGITPITPSKENGHAAYKIFISWSKL